MRHLTATHEPCLNMNILPYTAENINSVMIDYMLGQLPEQHNFIQDEDTFKSSVGSSSADIFLNIFGEPQTKKEFEGDCLFFYPLKDGKTLVISIDAFAYFMGKIHINDYDACDM